MKKTFALGFILAAGLIAHYAAAADGPITSVTLTTGGVAEIVRSAPVSDAGEIALTVPEKQMDDLLKSLVVLDSAGRVRGFDVRGPEPVKETFDNLPLSAADLGSLPTLLEALRGTRIKLAGSGAEGRVTGVNVSHGRHGDDKATLALALDDGSLRSVALGDASSVSIEDDKVRASIDAALDVLAKNSASSTRTLHLHLGEGPTRRVSLAYVVTAPVWKTAYRVLRKNDGKARLQAWAIFENATGVDWQDVEVTLSSGDPVTLRQKLYKRYWKNRPIVPVFAADAGVPAMDAGTLAAEAMPAPAAAPQQFRALADTASAKTGAGAGMASGETGAATEYDVAATFHLPGTFDLANGQTASVPIVDAEIPAQTLDVYAHGQSSPHPVSALALENDTATSLPPGIVTIYDNQAGYVGDARLGGLPKGAERMASFAVDRKVSVAEHHEPSETVSSIRAADGVLEATVINSNTTVYRIRGADNDDRRLAIDVPDQSGWNFESDALKGRTPEGYRLEVDVPAGQTVSARATFKRTHVRRIALSSADPKTLAGWSGNAPDKQTASRLANLAEFSRKVAAARRQVQQIDDRQQQVMQQQDRIRKNLGAVPEGSDLASRYLKMLADQEDRLANLATQRSHAAKALHSRARAMRDFISRF